MATLTAMLKSLLFLSCLTFLPSARAALVAEPLEYKDGDTVLEGILYHDDAATNQRPAVLVVPEWWGLGPFAKAEAKRLAAEGYITFAADMYGKGIYTEDPKRAAELAAPFRGTPLMARRAAAGLQALAAHPKVDATQLGAIGYCFGGSAVCELAYSGANVKGVVSFHGNLPAPQPAQLSGVKAKLLICHGAADPFVTPEALADFRKLTETLDVRFISYPDAVHAFTNPGSDAHHIPGVAYQKAAAEASWKEMTSFFTALFKR